MGLGRETQKGWGISRASTGTHQGQFEPWDENSCPWISNGHWLTYRPDPRWTYFAHPAVVGSHSPSPSPVGLACPTGGILRHTCGLTHPADSSCPHPSTPSRLAQTACLPTGRPLITDGKPHKIYTQNGSYIHTSPPLSPPPTIRAHSAGLQTPRELPVRPGREQTILTALTCPQAAGEVPPSLLSAWPGTRAAG